MDRTWMTSLRGSINSARQHRDDKEAVRSPYDEPLDAGKKIHDDPFDPGRYWDFFTGTD